MNRHEKLDDLKRSLVENTLLDKSGADRFVRVMDDWVKTLSFRGRFSSGTVKDMLSGAIGTTVFAIEQVRQWEAEDRKKEENDEE